MKSMRNVVVFFGICLSTTLFFASCGDPTSSATKTSTVSETPTPTPSSTSTSTPPSPSPTNLTIPPVSPSPTPTPIIIHISSPVQGATVSGAMTVSGTYTGSPAAILVSIGESSTVAATLGSGTFSATGIDTTGLTNSASKLVSATTQGSSPEVFNSITVNLSNASPPAPGSSYSISGTITNTNSLTSTGLSGTLLVWAKNASTGAIVAIQSISGVTAASYPVSYSLNGLLDSTTYAVGAYVDKNANGAYELIEASTANSNVILNGANVTGQNRNINLGYVSAQITSPVSGSALSGTTTFSGTYIGYPEAMGIILGEISPVMATFSGGTWSAQIDTTQLANDTIKAFTLSPGPNGQQTFEYYYSVSNAGAPASFTVSGSISIQPGHTPPAGIMRIYCIDANVAAMYSQKSYMIASADFPFAYSFTGVPSGKTIQILAFIDENNNDIYYDDHFVGGWLSSAPVTSAISSADVQLTEN
jgi:hypothetical protein